MYFSGRYQLPLILIYQWINSLSMASFDLWQFQLLLHYLAQKHDACNNFYPFPFLRGFTRQSTLVPWLVPLKTSFKISVYVQLWTFVSMMNVGILAFVFDSITFDSINKRKDHCRGNTINEIKIWQSNESMSRVQSNKSIIEANSQSNKYFGLSFGFSFYLFIFLFYLNNFIAMYLFIFLLFVCLFIAIICSIVLNLFVFIEIVVLLVDNVYEWHTATRNGFLHFGAILI